MNTYRERRRKGGNKKVYKSLIKQASIYRRSAGRTPKKLTKCFKGTNSSPNLVGEYFHSTGFYHQWIWKHRNEQIINSGFYHNLKNANERYSQVSFISAEGQKSPRRLTTIWRQSMESSDLAGQGGNRAKSLATGPYRRISDFDKRDLKNARESIMRLLSISSSETSRGMERREKVERRLQPLTRRS